MTQAEKTGARIARRRNERGLTQQQLAQQLGVTNKAVSKWETGAGLPDASVLPALARALGTTADALLRGDVQNGEEEENYQMEALAADRPGAFWRAAHTAPIPWGRKAAGWGLAFLLWAGALVLLFSSSVDLWVPVSLFVLAVVVADGLLLGVAGSIVAAYLTRSRSLRLGWTAQGFQVEQTGGVLRYEDRCLQAVYVFDRCLVLDLGAVRFPVQRQSAQGEDVLAYLSARTPGAVTRRRTGGLKAIAAVMTAGVLLFGAGALLRSQGMWATVSPAGHLLAVHVDRETGEGTWYRPGRVQGETLAYPVQAGSVPKFQWLTSDVCAVSYTAKTDGRTHQSVATYGDRGSGISYYHVFNAVTARWDDGSGTRLWAEEGALVLEYKGKIYRYESSSCVPFGTLALVLCDEDVPQFTVALGEDFTFLNGDDGSVGGGGSIVICPVSMEATTPVTLLYQGEV